VNDGVVAGCYLVTLREVVTYLPINYSLLSVPTALMIFTRTRWEKSVISGIAQHVSHNAVLF